MHPVSKAASRPTLVALVVGITVALGAPVAGAGGVDPGKPCRLVKASDVEKVFDSDDVESIEDPSGLSCAWEVDGGLGGDGPLVAVTYEIGPDAEESYRRFSGTGKPVPGLGDESYYSEVLGLHILSDGEYIAVEADYGLLGDEGPTEKQRKRKIVALAKKALARQPPPR